MIEFRMKLKVMSNQTACPFCYCVHVFLCSFPLTSFLLKSSCQIFFAAVVFGLFHGLVFLPVVLSYIGSPSHAANLWQPTADATKKEKDVIIVTNPMVTMGEPDSAEKIAWKGVETSDFPTLQLTAKPFWAKWWHEALGSFVSSIVCV